jgi:hypothetical protein
MHTDFGGKIPEAKILGRPKRRWEDNIKIHLEEMGLGILD